MGRTSSNQCPKKDLETHQKSAKKSAGKFTTHAICVLTATAQKHVHRTSPIIRHQAHIALPKICVFPSYSCHVLELQTCPNDTALAHHTSKHSMYNTTPQAFRGHEGGSATLGDGGRGDPWGHYQKGGWGCLPKLDGLMYWRRETATLRFGGYMHYLAWGGHHHTHNLSHHLYGKKCTPGALF